MLKRDRAITKLAVSFATSSSFVRRGLTVMVLMATMGTLLPACTINMADKPTAGPNNAAPSDKTAPKAANQPATKPNSQPTAANNQSRSNNVSTASNAKPANAPTGKARAAVDTTSPDYNPKDHGFVGISEKERQLRAEVERLANEKSAQDRAEWQTNQEMAREAREQRELEEGLQRESMGEQMRTLEDERDAANQAAVEAQIQAQTNAEMAQEAFEQQAADNSAAVSDAYSNGYESGYDSGYDSGAEDSGGYAEADSGDYSGEE